MLSVILLLPRFNVQQRPWWLGSPCTCLSMICIRLIPYCATFRPADVITAPETFHRPRQKQAHSIVSQIQPSRPLSSADEAGPLPKRLRSTARHAEAAKAKSTKVPDDDSSKKARARPALIFANIFSSSGRRSQPVTTVRSIAGVGKSNAPTSAINLATRRSTRLLGGATTKQSHILKVRMNSTALSESSNVTCYYVNLITRSIRQP